MSSSGNRFIAGIAVLAALGGFLFGYDTGVVGGAAPYIKKSMGIGAFGESWVVGSLLLGAIVGAFLSGKLADLLSRKWTKFAAGIVYTAAALGSALAPDHRDAVRGPVRARHRGRHRVVRGAHVHLRALSRRLRGGMTAFNQLMITFGILVAYLADFALSGFPHNWRWMFGFGAVPAICLAVAMALVPHTPRWLVQQGREDEARSVLRRSRADDAEIDEEINGIREAAGSQREFRLRDLAGPRLRRLLIIGVGMAMFQQILGINTVIYFGATILHFAGLPISTSVAQAVFLGIINFAGAAMAMLVLDRAGSGADDRRHRRVRDRPHRPRLVLPPAGFVPARPRHDRARLHHVVPGVLRAQPRAGVLGHDRRDLPAGLPGQGHGPRHHGQLDLQLPGLLLLPAADMAIGKAGTFWLYAGFGVAAVAFFWRWLPETKGRSLEEIEQQVS